jgi:hypothetical protein
MTNVLDDLAAHHNCSWQATMCEGMEAEIEKQIANDELGEKIEMLLSLVGVCRKRGDHFAVAGDAISGMLMMSICTVG